MAFNIINKIKNQIKINKIYCFFFSGGIGSGLFNDAPIINSYRSGKSDSTNKNGNSRDSSLNTKFSPNSGGSIIESGIGYLRNALFSNKNSGGVTGDRGENSNEFGGGGGGGEYRKLNLRAIDMDNEKPPPLLRNGYVQDPLLQTQQQQQLVQRNKNGNTNKLLGESKC